MNSSGSHTTNTDLRCAGGFEVQQVAVVGQIFRCAPNLPQSFALGAKKCGIDSVQASSMILSYFICVRSTNYEHAPENYYAD